jgi:hypothetical protein
MKGNVCFTSFTFGYLSRALVLARTLKAVHPDWELWALVVDEPPPELDQAEAFAPFDQVMYAHALGLPRFRAWLFKHDLVEACTAMKAPMLQMLLARGAERVIYLDPDIGVFAKLDFIERRLEGSSIVLTPHQSEANTTPAAIADNELTSLQYGIFNLGFLAVRNDSSGRAFARWWTEMTRAACYDDVAAGIFTDQKYCDLVPALFEGVHIERDPACNVASWNLSRRRLRFEPDGGLLVGGQALKFYHFTKIDAVGAVMTERAALDNMAVYEVVNWYIRAVAENAVPEAAVWPWRYGSFDQGEAVPRAVRLLWRARADLFAAYDDPFATGGDSFHAWLRREQPALLAAG